MPAPTNGFDDNRPAQVLHMPLRSKMLSLPEAAVHLGITIRRLKILAMLGAGPARTQTAGGKIAYRRDDLEFYLTALHEGADISGTEMLRRRAQAVATRQAALELVQIGATTGFPPPDPFMMLATGADARKHAAFFVIKVMALFGIILLVVSVTPILRTHFN